MEPSPVRVDAPPGDAGDLPDDAVQGRVHRLGVRGRRREPRLCEHPLSGPAGLLRRPAVGGARPMGEGAASPLRDR